MNLQTLSEQGRHTLLSAAVAAPSLHNTQPWRFAFDRGNGGGSAASTVDLYADPSRTLREVDPQGRQALLSCGAALLNLRVAAEHIGYEPRTLLLPDDTDPSHLATVHLVPRHGPSELAPLYPAIPQRRTNRWPFDGRQVPGGVAEEMSRAAELEGARLRFLSGVEYERVVALVHNADREWSTDQRLAAERAAWIGSDRDEDGVPVESLGPVAADASSVVRDLVAGGMAAERGHAQFEAAPTLAVLETPDDHSRAWLHAGMALERALLVATQHGVSASFVNAPAELPRERWLVRDPVGPWAYAQMLLRLGYGDPPPATPRRTESEVVVPTAR